MKYFYSYYPLRDIDGEDVFFDLICIKLSSTTLRKLGKVVGIYSTPLFIELLKKYEVELDFYVDIEKEIKDLTTDKLFAVSKVYSNSIQTEPFIQLDCDLILFDNFDFDKIEKSNILFHHIEGLDCNSPYDVYMLWRGLYMDFYYDILKKYPEIANETYMTPLIAYNCAIVGGNEWKLLSEGYDEIFNFIRNNKEYIENTNYYPMPELEQQLIVGILSKFGYNTHTDDKSSKVVFLDNRQDFVLYDKDDNMVIGYGDNSIYMKWDGEFKDFKNKQLLSLVYEKFGGFIHLTGSKGVVGIKNLIYEMLKIYDKDYVNWLEDMHGIQFEFQKKIYSSII